MKDRYIANECHFERCNYQSPHWRILDTELPFCQPIEDFEGKDAREKCLKRIAELSKETK